jgi:hypothetical protein
LKCGAMFRFEDSVDVREQLALLVLPHLHPVYGVCLRFYGFGFRLSGEGLRLSCFGFRVSCFVFRVSVSRFKV